MSSGAFGVRGSKLSSGAQASPARTASASSPKRKTATSSSTAAPVRSLTKSSQEEEIEKQYIWNLQQQVYYLELEMQYLREKEVTRVEGAPLPDEVAVKAAPLEATMKSLKQKYVDQQKAHEEEIQRLQERLAAQEERAAEQHFLSGHQRADIEVLTGSLARGKAEHEEAAAKWLAEKIALEKAIEARDSQIKSLEGLLADSKGQVAATGSALSEALLALRQSEDVVRERSDSDRRSKKRYDDLLAETERIRARIVELEEEQGRHQETIALVESQAKTASEERWKAEVASKEAALALDAAKYALTKAEADLQDTTRSNIKLQSNIADLQRDNQTLRFELERDRRVKDDNKTRRIEAENRLSEMSKQLQDANDLLAKKEANIVEVEKLCEKRGVTISRHLDEIKELNTKLDEGRAAYALQDSANAALRHDKTMLQSELASTVRALATMTEKKDDLVARNALLEAEAQRLTLVAKIGEDVKKLRIGEFENMMTSNFQIAHGLSTLLTDIKALKELDPSVATGGGGGGGASGSSTSGVSGGAS